MLSTTTVMRRIGTLTHVRLACASVSRAAMHRRTFANNRLQSSMLKLDLTLFCSASIHLRSSQNIMDARDWSRNGNCCNDEFGTRTAHCKKNQRRRLLANVTRHTGPPDFLILFRPQRRPARRDPRMDRRHPNTLLLQQRRATRTTENGNKGRKRAQQQGGDLRVDHNTQTN